MLSISFYVLYMTLHGRWPNSYGVPNSTLGTSGVLGIWVKTGDGKKFGGIGSSGKTGHWEDSRETGNSGKTGHRKKSEG